MNTPLNVVRTLLTLVLSWLACAAVLGAAPDASPASPAASGKTPDLVKVVPVKDVIAPPVLYVLKRAVKESREDGCRTLLLDMDTPGGDGATMEEIMDLLERCDGETIAYVNDDALSAGAIIASVCDHIYYAPKARIGASAAITATGDDIPETLRLKLNSALGAKVRTLAGKDGAHRAQVVRAMMEPDFELELDGTVIKPKGELLTLTAVEAMRPFGDPPRPLFGDGVADDVKGVLDALKGAGAWRTVDFKVTWSEHLAQVSQPYLPFLYGLGLLLVFIELKTPGFGAIGVCGIGLLLLGVLVNNIAGLAGNEAILFVGFGTLLLLVEVVFFPGSYVAGLLGVCFLVLGILFAGADLWPGDPVVPSLDKFGEPAIDLLIALGISIAGIVAFWKIIERTRLRTSLVLQSPAASLPDVVGAGGKSADEGLALPAVGATGVAVNDLRPLGDVDIGGRRFEARSRFGTIARGSRVVVVGIRNLALDVEPVRTENPPRA